MRNTTPCETDADYVPTLSDALGAIRVLAEAADDLTTENQELRQRIDDLEQDLAAAKAES